jgi:hypothetical protein
VYATATAHQDEVKQRCLVHLDELSVPLLDVIFALGWLVIHLLVGLHVELAVLDDLGQDLAGHVGQWDDILSASVCRCTTDVSDDAMMRCLGRMRL